MIPAQLLNVERIINITNTRQCQGLDKIHDAYPEEHLRCIADASWLVTRRRELVDRNRERTWREYTLAFCDRHAAPFLELWKEMQEGEGEK